MGDEAFQAEFAKRYIKTGGKWTQSFKKVDSDCGVGALKLGGNGIWRVHEAD